MILRLRTSEQMKFDEAGHAVEIGFAAGPDLLEGLLRAFLHFEAIHGDEHQFLLGVDDRRYGNASRRQGRAGIPARPASAAKRYE
jgi:hypothetical protein